MMDLLRTSLAKCLSLAVRAYIRWCPIERGKHRLTQAVAGFLVVPAIAGTWVRVTGSSGFEKKLLYGSPCEPGTERLFRALLKPGMTVLDVGANIGYFTLLASKLVGASGAVHVFEATPSVAARLRENVALNGLKNVTVNNLAVSETNGEVTLRLSDDSEANSLVNYGADWAEIRVRSGTLDDYIAAQNITRVDVVKIDVEGAEPFVLRGANALLRSDSPPALIIEANPQALAAGGSSSEELVALLRDRAYECYGIEQLTYGPQSVWNLLAVRSTRGEGGPSASAASNKVANFGLGIELCRPLQSI